MELKLFTFLVLAQLVSSRYIIIGPANNKIVFWKDCPDHKDLPMTIRVKSRMVNKTIQILDANMNLPFDFDRSITMTVKSQRIERNRVQANVFELEEGAEACNSLNKYVGELWSDIQSQLGVDPPGCPIKQGNYSAKNLSIDLSKMKIQMFLEGRFRTRVMFNNGTKPVLCLDIENILTPKKN